jgi:DNA-directed RNA polymerase subunit RPC12/RpoP
VQRPRDEKAKLLLSQALYPLRKLRYKQVSEMLRCGQCGGKLRRIHRTFFERFSYMAIYACKECKQDHFVPRRYRLHFGPHARCPVCGTYRIVKLKSRDGIDPMYSGFLNLAERMAGGKLYHCRYCRCQFYDRRKTAAEHQAPEESLAEFEEVTHPPSTAS